MCHSHGERRLRLTDNGAVASPETKTIQQEKKTILGEFQLTLNLPGYPRYLRVEKLGVVPLKDAVAAAVAAAAAAAEGV